MRSLLLLAGLGAVASQNYDVHGKLLNLIVVNTYTCSEKAGAPVCYVVTSSPSKTDVEQMFKPNALEYTRLLGVVPTSVDDIGEYFGKTVAAMHKAGPVKLAVLEGVDDDKAKKIRRQFPNMFKATRGQLPGDGKTHDDLAARLGAISLKFEAEGRGIGKSTTFFTDVMTTYAKEVDDALGPEEEL